MAAVVVAGISPENALSNLSLETLWHLGLAMGSKLLRGSSVAVQSGRDSVVPMGPDLDEAEAGLRHLPELGFGDPAAA